MNPMRQTRLLIEREDWTVKEEAQAVEAGRAAYRECPTGGSPLRDYLRVQHGVTFTEFNELPIYEREAVYRCWIAKVKLSYGGDESPWLWQEEDRGVIYELRWSLIAFAVVVAAVVVWALWRAQQ